MSVITTAQHPKLLWPGIKEIWGDAWYNEHDEQYSRIFGMESSTQHFEEFQGITGFGLMPEKTQGGALVYDAEQQGYNQRFTHLAYSLGYIVTKEELDDNLYEKVSASRSKNLARSGRQTIETVAFNHLNRAFNSSYTGADGKEMCATDHPNVNGGTWSNELATAADLSETAVEDLCIQIMNATDDRGLKANIKPKCLVVSTNDAFNSIRIMKSQLQNDTANNAINALKYEGAIGDRLVSNYLTDTDAWFITTDAPEGLKFIWRVKPEFDKDDDFSTKNLLASMYMRFSSGWCDPRGIFGTSGAA